jgi:putative membrane protein
MPSAIRGLCLFVLLAVPSAQAPGGTGSTGVTGEDDGHFLRQAVQTSRQALTDAGAAVALTDKPEIRNAARTIWNDHVRASHELSDLAKQKGMRLPTEASIAPRTSPRTSESSDAAWIASLLEANEEAVAVFHQEAVRGSDTELRQFAQRTLPTLQRRLHTLRCLQDAYPV